MDKARKEYIRSCEVSELLTVELGGYEQKILIEGKTKNLPVVICLHGGPGSPVPFSVGCRGLFPEWTQKAIMVFWDQLGCGINNRLIDDSFKTENFVDMTCDLVNFVKEKFPKNKLFLFGVSWGSILSLQSALRIPEKLDGVFVYGQVLKNLFFNGEVTSAFEGAPEKVIKQVNKILETGVDCEDKILNKNLKTLYKLLSKYTNAYTNKNAAPAPIGKIIKGLMQSPDYKFRDFMAVVKNGYAKNISLLREHLNSDLSPRLSELKVKYLMLQGDTDIVTSTANVLKAVESCGNKNVTVKVVKNSGHMPSSEAMEECFKTLLQFVQ
ncbi:MAG: alpha/beta fold hydrolase [Clostridia bacterium]|nr:alpha/beta fold hydrolase [Clostridia bacterium]